MDLKKIAVIGAGPMGLMATYRLLQQGHQVTLFERDDRIGGMTASFDFDGLKLERFYHFICKTDYPLFEALKEFGLMDKLRWVNTKLAFYSEGQEYPWGDPICLLKFPKLGLVSKLRYAWMAYRCTKVKDWSKLDQLPITPWLKKNLGEKTYQTLWKRLFHYKFYEYQHDLSAAWLAARIYRVGTSRDSIFKEALGYLEGGSDALLSVMEQHIVERGGHIQLNADVQEIVCEKGVVKGVRVGEETREFDAVVSTIPLPYVSRLVPALSADEHEKIQSIKNVGVVCGVFKLKQPFTQNFWMNISDERMEIPGIIEYSNLNPLDQTIVYVPYYLPQSHEKYGWSDSEFIEEMTRYLKLLKPDFDENDILATHVARYQFAQTVTPPGFKAMLPDMNSSLEGFYMADTAYYYPFDRSISESFKVGETLAALCDEAVS